MSKNFNRRAILGGLAVGAAAGTMPLRAATSSTTTQTAAPATEHILLWPNGVPAETPPNLQQQYIDRPLDNGLPNRMLVQVTAPFIERIAPTVPANGASIVIMPGGGYRGMAWDKEALDIADWFAARGVTAFALGYRLPRDGWANSPEAPLIDAQRAMRLIRFHAPHWGLDESRVAALGFSAGGQLTTNLAARFADALYPVMDEADLLSARPMLAAGIYPAVSLIGSAETLFKQPLSDALLAANSPHLHVPDDAPPHILIHAEDDPVVKPDEHTMLLRAALKAKNIPVETHLYEKGGHGFGLRAPKPLSVASWPERVMDYGRAVGWV